MLFDWSRKLAPPSQPIRCKLKPIAPWSLAFSRATGRLHAFTSSCHWLPLIISFTLIGRCDYFGFGFRHSIEKRSKLLSWYVSCEGNIHSSASKRPISEAQFKNCWIVTARSRSLTESLKIPLVRQNWGRQYTACKEYYNVYVAWIHVHIKSQISISNLYFNTVKIHQVFCYI